MHHNRSLLPDVEVLLSVMVKTSRCSTKLLFLVINFYSWFFSHNFRILIIFLEFQPDFRISTKFQNFNQLWNFPQISEFQSDFRISTKFPNFNQILKFQPNFDWSMTKCKIIWRAVSLSESCFSWTFQNENIYCSDLLLSGNDDLIWTHMRRTCWIMIKVASLEAHRPTHL